MKSTFEEAALLEQLGWVLAHEGGWSDHPKDPGGATMKGVTLQTFRMHFGDELGKEDLKAITDDELMHIYRAGYWDPLRCSELPRGVDYCVFDAGVNSGIHRSARWLQEVVKVRVDGIVGPVTVRATLDLDPVAVIRDLCDRRLAFLQGLSIFDTFGRGWTRRVADVRQKATQLALR